MKATTFKTLIVLAVLSSCNHNNSPAPANPAPSNPTPTANTPEGVASSLVGHWYLDSTHYYSSPTNYVVTKYGTNHMCTGVNDYAQHEERDLTSTVTSTVSNTSQSNCRQGSYITWQRKITNDTLYYTSINNPCWAVVYDGNTFTFNGGNYTGYIRSLTGNNLIMAANTSTTKSGYWYYWHRQ